MRKNDAPEAMRDKKERALSQLAGYSQLFVSALETGYLCSTCLVCVPDLLNFFYHSPTVVHNCVDSVGGKLGVVTVDHGATAWQVFG